jgi:hypothetical protein
MVASTSGLLKTAIVGVILRQPMKLFIPIVVAKIVFRQYLIHCFAAFTTEMPLFK